jgi:hypothetical protein
MTNKYPIKDWEFVDEIEENFQEWFNGMYGEYSLRSEWFFGDCEVEDEKTRKDLMYRWIYASFYSAWERAQYAMLETNQLGGTE